MGDWKIATFNAYGNMDELARDIENFVKGKKDVTVSLGGLVFVPSFKDQKYEEEDGHVKGVLYRDAIVQYKD